jgi:hypothetical protein
MSNSGDIRAAALAAAAEPALPEELEAFARIEGLVGQEHALLLVPAAKRSAREHRLLDAVTAELDRIADKLKQRPVRPAG